MREKVVPGLCIFGTRCIEDCATPDRIFRVGTLWSEDFVVCAQYEASVSALLELLCFRHQRKKEIERSTVDVTEAARKLFSFPPEKSYFFRSSQVPDVILVG